LISYFCRVLNVVILFIVFINKLPAYEDGTDRVFRNVGIQNLDAGELLRRKHTTSLSESASVV
jgi:hypothetical protein